MHLTKRYLLFLIILTITNSCFGQSKRSAHWYFGYGAGIDFHTGIPQADTTGILNSIESCASISDTLGNLLFYTNGQSIWNKDHIIMPNGHGLSGNESAAQGALFVPLPNSNSLYYLFTTDQVYLTFPGDSPGLQYSIIDLGMDNGRGDVTAVKNVLLFDSCTEEIAGTKHCNGKDYWIVARKLVVDTLKFYAYLLTESGISDPVITNKYTGNSIYNSVGAMTFSQDGKTFVFSSFLSDIFIFDFDKQTGALTLHDSIARASLNEVDYSNAISPDKSKLYVTRWVNLGWNYLSQFDLNSPDIASTRIDLDSVDYSNGSPNGYGFIGAIRLASDQKIYVSRWKEELLTFPFYSLDSLDVINTPNAPGLACNFQRNAVYLNHKPAMIGLPNFISNFTTDDPNPNSCPVLPIGLLDFKYELKETKVKLDWKTLYESNNDYFFIERSSDADHFQTIGKIKGSLNSTTLKQYAFYDNDPLELNYYRLKQVDLDGDFTYSKSLLVKFNTKTNISLLQNPVNNNLQVRVRIEEGLPGILKLYDLSGRLIKIFDVKNGVNNIDVSFLTQGTYLLQLITNENEVSNIKFIKLNS